MQFSLKFLFIIFFSLLVQQEIPEENNWDKMYPQNIGDYWVYEEWAPFDSYMYGISTKRVIGDTIDGVSGINYKKICMKNYSIYSPDSYSLPLLERIDSSGYVFRKYYLEGDEKIYLPLFGEEGDTIFNPDTTYGGYWVVNYVWSDEFGKNMVIEFWWAGASGYHIRENLGELNAWGEGGGATNFRGAYVNGTLIGDTSIVTAISKETTTKIVKQLLLENYPNPFNPSTTIRFTLPQAAQVRLAIFNTLGQRVKEASYNSLPTGEHHYIWDGTDESGATLASGVYILQLNAAGQAGQFNQSIKMLLIR